MHGITDFNPKNGRRDSLGLIKFGVSEDQTLRRYSHANTWMHHSHDGIDRLVIAPEKNHLHIMVELAKAWSGKSYLLYVLIYSRLGLHPTGRYQSRPNLSHSDIKKACSDFKTYLETDGRHHLWIASLDTSARVVYDHHNIIYAYGDLEIYKSMLKSLDFVEGPYTVPEHHAHVFHPANDYYEDKIMSRGWAWCPLNKLDTDYKP